MFDKTENSAPKRAVKTKIILIAGAMAASLVAILMGLIPNSFNSFQPVFDKIIELLSSFSSLVILLVVYFLLKFNSTNANKKDDVLVFLRETAYYQSLELKIVIFQCSLNDVSLINSLFGLSDLFPLSVVLSPRDKRIFFLFSGKDLQDLRERCHKGLIYLKDVYSEVKRLNKAELESFFADLGWETSRIDKIDKEFDDALSIYPLTSTELADFLALMKQRNDNRLNYNEDNIAAPFIPLFKESKHLIFCFNQAYKNESAVEEKKSRKLILSDEELKFSFVTLIEKNKMSKEDFLTSEVEEDGKESYFEEKNQLKNLDYLFHGCNAELVSKKIHFTNFVTFLSLFTADEPNSLLSGGNNIEEDGTPGIEQVQPEYQNYLISNSSDNLESQQLEKNENISIVENEASRRLEEELDSEKERNIAFDYISPICLKICSEMTRLEGETKKQEFCTPNITYCFNKLFNESYITYLEKFRRSSIQELVERVISDCNNVSFSQIVCLFNLLCYSSSFSDFFDELEVLQIEQLLSTLSSANIVRKRLLTSETVIT
ncbi:MAG: hypothetical protein ACFFD4_20700 [Candidatus Odinarchaeota archaeon]